jgi:FMN hydrolase / 5-amino-6-(5-phospho-D-ribitylamino)uracil phosphatase
VPRYRRARYGTIEEVADVRKPRVRAIAFDVMDTLVHDPFREALVAATGLPLDELFARRRAGVYPAFERGELDEVAYWAHYGEAGITVDADEFHRVRRAGIRWLPGMRALLDDLGGVVLRATASNYPVWIEQLATDHLAGRVDRVVASCHLGIRKPDRGFYIGLLERLGLPAEAVLFVDDREENVRGAIASGLRAHRFSDAATVRAWLVEQGVAVGRAA